MKSSLEGVKKVPDLGLNAMEIEFVYGVKMSNELAKKIGKESEIKLSVHAPYYINLYSKEKKKIEQSKKRILNACERGHHMNASCVVFHPGFYGDYDKEDVYQGIKEAIDDIQKTIKKNNWNIELAPETTGKHSQFGSLEELTKLAKELKCNMCVDFAHLYARNNGKIDYSNTIKQMKKLKHIKHFHSHFSGIEFTEKGERRHKVMSEPKFQPLAKEIIKEKLNITIISESTVTWKDSLKQKEIFKRLGYNFS